MRKAGRIGILFAGMVIILGIAITVDAQEQVKSCGTVDFQCVEGNVSIWAEDISLLQSKVYSITEDTFNPEYYSGTLQSSPNKENNEDLKRKEPVIP